MGIGKPRATAVQARHSFLEHERKRDLCDQLSRVGKSKLCFSIGNGFAEIESGNGDPEILSLANFYFKRLLAAEIARGNNRERRYTHLGGVSPEAFEAASLSGWKVSLYRGKSILSVGTV